MKTLRYTIDTLHQQFPNDDACLDYMFQRQYGDLPACPKCCITTPHFYRVRGRKCYACNDCGYQISPLANTIFHKSETPLKKWFYAIYLFGVGKNGVSAKEIERHLGVTYKTAWRMAKQIRLMMQENSGMLSGIIEAGSTLQTDDSRIYSRAKRDFTHEFVNHSKLEYVKAGIHTNTIEGFWGQLKRSLDGTYHCVSPKYLQFYVNEFVYRYNHRDVAAFPALLEAAVLRVQ
jgi:transposase